MDIKTTEDFLNKFDYKYERKAHKLIIKLDYSHRILMNFKNPKKVVIKDQLTPWNFITGPVKTSIKKGIILNNICIIVLSIGIGFFDLKAGIAVFSTLIIWSLVWSIFHVSKYENLRYMLTNGHNLSTYSIEY